MPISNDRIENDIVMEEFAAKVGLETQLALDLSKFFRKIVLNTRRELNVKSVQFEYEYDEELQTILSSSYKDTQAASLDFFLEDDLIKDTLSEQEIANIRSNTIESTTSYNNKRAKDISKELLETTGKNLDDSYSFVDKFARENEILLTTAERDSLALDKFQQKLDNRVDTISVTETQNIYENTKQLEGDVLVDKLANKGVNMQKRWNALLDGSTRPAHARAHGQRVPVSSMYSVWGESLKYPGDTTNGSAKNTINCRCSSQYIVLE